jgi:peptide/nickel transport system ATP-binding protein
MVNAPALAVVDLRVVLDGSDVDIVDEVSFTVDEGTVLGLVGESGSGKSTVALALLGHQRSGVRIDGGSVRIDGRDILALPAGDLRRIRGRVVSYVPQDPSAALNPALRIGTQLEEVLRAHDDRKRRDARRARILEMLDEVRLPADPAFLARYPHQLSGGQQQRVTLAMAFACRPRVIVLDEPTTGLDVTTQAHVLETVRDLCRTHRVAAVYVSHDLAVVAELATRVAVMYAGRLVELGPGADLFRAAAHPYTRRLIGAIPDLSGHRAMVGILGRAPAPGYRPAGCSFAPRCALARADCLEAFPVSTPIRPGHLVRCIRAEEVVTAGVAATRSRMVGIGAIGSIGGGLSVRGVTASYGGREVLHGLDIDVQPGRCLALVGESGSGKTTLARCIAGLHGPDSGRVELHGAVLQASASDRTREARRAIQYIFQNPYGSLNPRKTLGEIIGQPLRLFFDPTGPETAARTREALDRVALPPSYVGRFPDQLSGGERQRVAIARALVAEPSLLVCDEVTSSLDVSVQAAIVELLDRLRREMGLGILFVTHNLALIRAIAQTVAVLHDGRIVDSGPVERVLASPHAGYTQALLSNTPSIPVSTSARRPALARH